jgi:hypothetical protein
MLDSNLGGNKKGQNRNKSILSSQVGRTGQMSNFFIQDLKDVAASQKNNPLDFLI